MKKQLLMAGFLLAGMFSVNAQVLQSDNFDSYNVGNLSSDLTGQTPGQGGWVTLAASGGNVNNFQIVAEGTGKSLQMQGINVATSTQPSNTRIALKSGINWANRTSGNNISKFEYDLYTGASSTSKNFQRGVIVNSQGGTIGGFEYEPATREISGLFMGNTEQGGLGLFGASLGGENGGQPLLLNNNEWVKLVFFINHTTGEMTFTIPGKSVNLSGANPLFANNATYQASGVAFFAIGGPQNTVSSTVKYDNYSFSAVNNTTVSTGSFLSQQFAMYPNPTTGIVNITNNENVLVSQVNVSDLNGRVVKTVKFENVSEAQVDISGLSAGMYIMNITTNQGTATKKVVKK